MPKGPRVLQKVDELVRLSVGGKYPESIAAGQEALRFAPRPPGPEHPDTAACLNLFGSLLHQFGDSPEPVPTWNGHSLFVTRC